MRQNRQFNEVREISLSPNYISHAEGSVLLKWGNNKVLSTVTIEETLPPHLRYDKSYRGGWLTAEYAMMPRSTEVRSQKGTTLCWWAHSRNSAPFGSCFS